MSLNDTCTVLKGARLVLQSVQVSEGKQWNLTAGGGESQFPAVVHIFQKKEKILT